MSRISDVLGGIANSSAALLGIFTAGFLAIAGLGLVFQNLIDDLDNQLSDERAHLFIAEQIVHAIRGVESLFYQMATARDDAMHQRQLRQIRVAAGELEAYLRVMRDGGEARRSLALNLFGIDEVDQSVHYRPQAEQSEVTMLAIEIAPFLEQIPLRAAKAAELLQRLQRCGEDNLACQREAEEAIQLYYKALPSFFFRLSENANRQLFESSTDLHALEERLIDQHARLRRTLLVMVLLVMLSVMAIGFVFTRRMNAAQRHLKSAREYAEAARAQAEVARENAEASRAEAEAALAQTEIARAQAEAAREQAEAANQAKFTFLATMSHEIRTPMNGILGMAQVLDSRELSAGERKDCVRVLLSSSQTLLAVLNDILNLSKVEDGKLKIQRVECFPDELVSETVNLFKEAAFKKHLVLGCGSKLGENACYLIDQSRLRQMLANLIGNAIKFTDHGVIGVMVSETADHDGLATLQFSVSDTGVGIPEDKRSLLFQPFSQVDGSMSLQRPGSTGPLHCATARNGLPALVSAAMS